MLGHWAQHLPEASYPGQFLSIPRQCHLIVCLSFSNAACSVCDHRQLAQWCGHLPEVGDESCRILGHAQEKAHFRYVSGLIHPF